MSSWVWDVALDSRQRPVIVYATFRSLSNHAYWYAHWDGQRWVSHFMTYAGPTISPGTIETEYSGGIALDHADPSIVYLSRKVNSWFEIERWVTTTAATPGSHSTVVRTPGTGNVRPVVPRGGGKGLIKLLWLHGHYISYTAYRTSIAYLVLAVRWPPAALQRGCGRRGRLLPWRPHVAIRRAPGRRLPAAERLDWVRPAARAV